MRHRKAGIKLNRSSSHRKAMFRNMVTSLFKYERIKTTDAKAKEIRRWADKLITLAKRGDLHARRKALSIIREKAVVHKLFEEAPKKFGTVSGGYTHVVKMGFRSGDAASVSLVELIIPEEKPKKKKAAKKKPKTTKAVEKKQKENVEKSEGPDEKKETAPNAEKVEGAEDSDDKVETAAEEKEEVVEKKEEKVAAPEAETKEASAEEKAHAKKKAKPKKAKEKKADKE